MLPADHIEALWDTSGFYPSFVAQPFDTTGPQRSKHVGNAFTIQQRCVGHPVPPPNVQEAPETPKMETVQPLLLACVCSPCFAAVQKKA